MTKIKTTTPLLGRTVATSAVRALLFFGLAFVLTVYPATVASADTFDEQIQALQDEAQQFQVQAAQLKAQADTLQNAIAAINAQQSGVQTQIEQTEVRLDQLNTQIQQTQERITNQKNALALNLKSLYIESSISSLEMIASSNSISDFVNKQEYRNKINDSIQDSLKQIKALKITLDQQKTDVERTLADQKAMRTQLAAQEAEKNTLLAQTQGQEAAYQQLVGQKNSQISSLRAQQAAANLKWSGGNVNFQARGGGYPSFWADPPMDSMVDDWGMYNRECVSYTAFRVAASNRYIPYGLGNANMWPGGARAHGIRVDSNPKAGDVAVWPIGYYGHVMYVESVGGDGSIVISEYNYDWTGRYSTRSISVGTWRAQGFEFIHF